MLMSPISVLKIIVIPPNTPPLYFALKLFEFIPIFRLEAGKQFYWTLLAIK